MSEDPLSPATLLYSEDSPATKVRRGGDGRGKEKKKEDFPEGPVIKTVLPLQWVQVQSPGGEVPHAVRLGVGQQERKKKREGREGRKGKGQFNWKGGRLPSSGLWEQWGTPLSSPPLSEIRPKANTLAL